MASGGARNRSGPPKDPKSGRSDRLGFVLTALPADGYGGDVPDLSDYLLNVTPRHLAIWEQLWSTPQACAWSMESWRWPIVADLVAARVRADDPESPVGLLTSIRQLRDDCGLSAAGLIQNGWAIGEAKADPGEGSPKPARQSSRDRGFRVVNGGA